jgi:beta-carotene hydroxylase
MRHLGFPTLDTLGRDLLVVTKWRRAVSLATPFLLTTAFFVFAANGVWIASLVCTMLLTFLTYGSISHDLVHRTLRLPGASNEALLSPRS